MMPLRPSSSDACAAARTKRTSGSVPVSGVRPAAARAWLRKSRICGCSALKRRRVSGVSMAGTPREASPSRRAMFDSFSRSSERPRRCAADARWPGVSGPLSAWTSSAPRWVSISWRETPSIVLSSRALRRVSSCWSAYDAPVSAVRSNRATAARRRMATRGTERIVPRVVGRRRARPERRVSRLGDLRSRTSWIAPRIESMRHVRALLADGPEPYAGGDLANARRLGALIWTIATVFAAALLPLSPPDVVLGIAGWPLVGAGMAAGLLVAHRMLSPQSRVGWDELLAMSYLATAQLALVHWLTGGGASAYAELYLLIAAYAGAIHPPRRVLGVLAAVAVASGLPLVYGGWDAQLAGQTIARVLIGAALALVACVLMSNVRTQRVALQDEAR